MRNYWRVIAVVAGGVECTALAVCRAAADFLQKSLMMTVTGSNNKKQHAVGRSGAAAQRGANFSNAFFARMASPLVDEVGAGYFSLARWFRRACFPLDV